VLAGHDRYEVLAGAIALGEATAAERASFDAHAATCAPCRADAAAAGAMAGMFEDGRAAECWRPSLGAAVERRIRETRRSRLRLSVGALSWCVALSLAVDLAFAGGFAGRIAHAFEPRADATSAGVAAAPHPVAVLAARESSPQRRAAAHHRRAADHARGALRVAARPHPAAPAASVPAEPAVPDVLAGLDLYGKTHDAARSVALEPKHLSPERPTP
jgi:hypothetical protein